MLKGNNISPKQCSSRFKARKYNGKAEENKVIPPLNPIIPSSPNLLSLLFLSYLHTTKTYDRYENLYCITYTAEHVHAISFLVPQ